MITNKAPIIGLVTLYKNGKASPPLYPIDAIGWKKAGWSDQNIPPSPPAQLPETLPVIEEIGTEIGAKPKTKA